MTRVEPSKLFSRRGADLVIDVPVTYAEAALGATVEVPTPYGERVSLKVPAGTQEGRQLRIRGHGAPKLGDGGGKGDLIARLRVTVPKKLTKAEREALEQLQKISKRRPEGDAVLVKIAAVILVGVGTVGLIVTFVLMRRKLEELHRIKEGEVMDERPRYMISVAAELVGMHPQTLRIYEAKGLIRPKRTAGQHPSVLRGRPRAACA